MSFTERSASLLMDMIIHMENELIKQGIAKDKASSIAKEICDQLRQTFGGEQFYFPKGRELDAVLKHHAIYQKFNGTNHVELAKQFDMTVPAIYRIVKSVHKEETDKRQPQLF